MKNGDRTSLGNARIPRSNPTPACVSPLPHHHYLITITSLPLPHHHFSSPSFLQMLARLKAAEAEKLLRGYPAVPIRIDARKLVLDPGELARHFRA